MQNKNKRSQVEIDSILDLTLRATGLDQIIKTDPIIINKILKLIKLDTFQTSFQPLQKVLTDAKKNPQDLFRFIDMIKKSLRKNDAIIDFLAEGNSKNWFVKHKDYKTAINMAFILENLTIAAVNCNTMLSELNNHILESRNQYRFNPRSPLQTFFYVMIASDLFFASKCISVDPGIKTFILRRNNDGKLFSKSEIKELSKKGIINFIEKTLLNKTQKEPGKIKNCAIQINILEAGITEYDKGYKDNALVAYALMKGLQQKQNIFYKKGKIFPKSFSDNPDKLLKKYLDSDNYFESTELTQEWINLYSAWNMSFVLADQKDVELVMPKLFIPSQIDAKPDEYLFGRVITLWNVVNLVMIKKVEKIPQSDRPSNRREIASGWGKINRKHALKYVEKELGINPDDFEIEFKKYFTKRKRNFFSMLKSFFT